MRCLIAGGGTGGHLFPGVALAEALVARDPGTEVRFVCTPKGLDRRLLEPTGWSFEICEAPKLPRSASALASLPLSLARAGGAAWRVVRRFRPHVVVGCGGHGSFAPAMAAFAARIPVALLEQNVIPGRTTKLLARRAGVIFGQWPEEHLRWRSPIRYVAAGNPLRAQFAEARDREACRAAYRLPGGEVPGLLVFGGSQGARSLNLWVAEGLAAVGGLLPRCAILHLCGSGERERLLPLYARAADAAPGLSWHVAEFEPDMGRAYAAVDLAIGRAGGTGIAEMTARGLPMVLIPYPEAADDHQRANASAVAAAGAGLVFEERHCDTALLRMLLEEVLLNRARREALARGSQALGRPDAARSIAEELIAIAAGTGRS